MDPRRVLLADDEAHITHLLARRLESMGHDVRVARDGEEAWAILLEWTPDMMITDLQMPYISGIELVSKARQKHLLDNVPVIMLTARGYILNKDQIEEAGITKLVSKPFSVRGLTALVTDLLEEYGNARRAA